jgi:hypothetical protein
MHQEDEPFAPDHQDDYLKPLVTAWLGRINQAEESRTPWKKLGDECMHFYEATANFLWDASSQHKFWEGVTQPTFRVVIAKAFELVAQIGPTLFFRAPRRKVSPRRIDNLPPEMFGDVENDPQAQAVYQQYQMEMSAEMQADMSRAAMMETWLNYTPDQMPGGGMEEHVERAIVEALIRGRGVLWPQPYQVPGSDRTLTGLFYDTVENLYIDPDAEKLEDARWFARRRIESYQKVEQKFNLPRNSLKGKTTLDSLWAASATAQARPSDVKAKDLVVYYEVYSKNGPGCDCTGLDWRVSEHLRDVAGDYAYLAICPSCDYPLNLPAEMLTSGATDELVRDAMQWPIPFWAGNHLPFVPLDFYPSTRSVWPMPPLAPGIGELKFLNVMVSHLCNRIWMSSRDFIAVAKSAQKEVERIIREGQDLSILPVSDHHEDISKMIKFLDQPNVNVDAWHIIDRVAQMFDKRTGLTDLVYGLTDSQSRSAEDAATKRQAVSARPDHMARKVEKWMARASSMEAFCTRWFVEAKDVAPLIGNTAASLWSWLIDSQDVDLVVREMEYTVVAGSGRRRNHELELSNLNQALQFFFPEISKHADITTDVSALNALIQRWGDAAQIDLSDIILQPRMPPQQEGPNPMEIEMQMKQEEHQMDMASKQADLQMKQIEAEMKMQIEQQKIQLDSQKLQAQAMIEQNKAAIEAATAQNEMQTRQEEHMIDMAVSGDMHQQKLLQDQQSHDQKLKQSARKAELDLLTTAAKVSADIAAARRRASMKPQQTPARKKSKAVSK